MMRILSKNDILSLLSALIWLVVCLVWSEHNRSTIIANRVDSVRAKAVSFGNIVERRLEAEINRLETAISLLAHDIENNLPSAINQKRDHYQKHLIMSNQVIQSAWIRLINAQGQVVLDGGTIDHSLPMPSYGGMSILKMVLDTGKSTEFSMEPVSGRPGIIVARRLLLLPEKEPHVLAIKVEFNVLDKILESPVMSSILVDTNGVILLGNPESMAFHRLPASERYEKLDKALRQRYYGTSQLPVLPFDPGETNEDGLLYLTGHPPLATHLLKPEKKEWSLYVFHPVSGLESLKTTLNWNAVLVILAGWMAIAVVHRWLKYTFLLRHKAFHDPLTGAYNRQFLLETTPHLLSAHDRGSLPGLGLVMIDLDHFKGINDTYGHQAGDEALKRLVRILSQFVRNEDIAFRYGGEEFGVLFLVQSLEQLRQLSERIRSSIQNVSDLAPIPPGRLTASMGIVMRTSGMGLEEMIAVADKNLYEAKRNGRNRVEG
ncbi:MAG: GGDEF domain-containing protein [Magnetococcales bacterium]|nr:GGDEF domain-containing protein [Magnetococcales bacterium]